METAGLVVGLVALAVAIMAIPTIFQMLFGRPNLSFEADEFTGPDGKILVIAIKNEPVKNKFLLWMGVEREAGDILAFFEIQEHGTRKFLARSVSGLLQCAPMRTIGLLARSLPGFSVGLTIIGTKDGKATIVDARGNPIPIGEGHYTASIDIIRGQKTYKIAQAFTVGKADHQTIWYQRNVSIL